MNNPDIRKEMAGLISTLKAHFDDLDKQEQLSQDELKALMEETELLYKKMVIFNYLGTKTENVAEVVVPVSLEEREIVIVDPPKNELIAEPEPESKNQPAIIENKTEEHLPVSEANVITDLKEESIVMPVAENVTIKSSGIKEEKTVNARKESLADIKAGIGINDKFQFISELFAGNGDKYEEAIKQFNSLESIESSLLYVEALRAQYGWKDDADAAQRLTELVKRRFL